MKHRQNLTLLSISILLMLLLVALSGSVRNGGTIISPLDVQPNRPTLPPPDWTITPVSNLPLTLYNYSPLPTPTPDGKVTLQP